MTPQTLIEGEITVETLTAHVSKFFPLSLVTAETLSAEEIMVTVRNDSSVVRLFYKKSAI